MKQDDMIKRLRKAALVLPLVALPACTSMAQQKGDPYKVVINHEEQYSIWPTDRETPQGWEDTGETGTREECRAYIEEVWTDMRPLSLRKKIKQEGLNPGDAGYKVVINHEEQYAIWLATQEMTGKWQETGKKCSLQDCRAYIEEVWTDMRPLSLRKK